ncbi:MAG: hypothetical protein Q9218_007253 [Villophora microphyllina]
MVIIRKCILAALTAYSTTPLTSEMTRTIQHGIYDGTLARYDNQQVTLTIRDRPDFYGTSHYDIRIIFNSEGQKDPFLIIDSRTPELNTAWYVESTDFDNLHNAQDWRGRDPPITYPNENFTLWQGHMHIPDIPISVVSWNAACSDLVEAVI